MIWSGDTTSVWETLSAQVASGLSAAATGWSWWTLDIGGFQPDPTVWWSGNIGEAPYRELYVRWLQWGTFLPFMRNVSPFHPLHHATANLGRLIARLPQLQLPGRLYLQ